MFLNGGKHPSVLGMVQLYNGTSAWRMIWPAEYLRRRGYPVMWGYNGEIETATVTAQADVVVMHRLAWELKDWKNGLLWRDILHADGKALIYELDDDILSPSVLQRIQRTSLDPKPDAQVDAERNAHLFSMRLCDGVICSTEYLADLVRGMTEKPVLVVPNAIDIGRFRASLAVEPAPAEGSPPSVGWVGGNRPDSDAFHLAGAWYRLAQKYPNLRFVVGGFPLGALVTSVPRDRLTIIPWRQIDAYPRTFRSITVGCAPLADEPFNRSKSAIKIMEYAVAGAAVVASPVVYGQVIQHGHNGLLASRTEEWYQAISTLLDYPEQKRAMAANLLREVEQKYSLDANAYRWPEAWNTIFATFRMKSLGNPRSVGDPTARNRVLSTRLQGRDRTGVPHGRGEANSEAAVVRPRQLALRR